MPKGEYKQTCRKANIYTDMPKSEYILTCRKSNIYIIPTCRKVNINRHAERRIYTDMPKGEYLYNTDMPKDAVNGQCDSSNCTAGQYWDSNTVACMECDPGFFCLGGSNAKTPCAAGEYSNSGSTSSGDCQTCPSGQFSSAGSTCLPCPAGFSCDSSTGITTSCTGTQYSLDGDVACNACPSGYYCPSTSQPPQFCPDGHVPSADQTTCDICTAGNYAYNVTSLCQTCPAGYHCPTDGMSSPEECPTGWYSASSGASACTECAAGRYCTSTTETLCNAGYYSNAGQTSCDLCPGGYDCSDSSTIVLCQEGFYSRNGSSSCTSCEEGRSCPGTGRVEPLECELGTYANVTESPECLECPAGYKCPVPSQSPVFCIRGTYSAAGSTSCTACLDGEYADTPASEQCSPCTAGYSCVDKAQAPQACPAGTYSPGGLKYCSSCPAGWYADGSTADSCTDCPAGSKCSTTGLEACSDGYYSLGNTTTCTICPAGHECSNKAVDPVQCMAGTYAPESSTSCSNCDAGYQCPTDGLSNQIICSDGTYQDLTAQTSCSDCPAGKSCSNVSSTPVDCSSGYYSVLGSTSCTICPVGHKCPTTTAEPTSCNSGEYAPAGQTDCTPCEAGNYCPDPPSSGPINCPSGWYTETTGNTVCTKCPTGSKCPDATTAPESCAAGYYTDQMGSTECIACLSGYYNLNSGSDSCIQCPSGSKCPVKDQAPIECGVGTFSPAGSDKCYTCPAGQSCGDPTGTPTLCNVGEYSNGTACVICPAGFKCPSPLSNPTECDSGLYQDSAGQSTCLQCPAGSSCYNVDETPVECGAGYYSLAYEAACTVCPDGQWSDSGAATCQQCPAGQYCFDGSAPTAPTDCDAGYAAAEGVGICSACPQGTYSAAGASYCSICPAGTHCSDPTNPEACDKCPAGFSCANAAQPPQACSVGQYSTSGQTACVDCPAGQSCIDPGDTPQNCDAGYYSGLGDSQCYPCPAGSDCTDAAVALADCASGYYSLRGQHGCTECPAGSMCPDIDQEPITCAVGQHTDGLAGQITCTDCPPGKYCSDTSVAPQDCSAGTYSLTNYVACTDCPAGYECPTTDAAPVACDPGSYTANTGLATSCTPCEAGYACPSTRDVSEKFACQPGSYALAGASYCTACTAGKECPNTNDDSTITDCTAGTYSYSGYASCQSCPAGWKCTETDGSGNAPCIAGTYSTGSATDCTACPAGKACPRTDTSDQIDCVAGYYSVGEQTSCTMCPPGYECPDSTSDTETPCADGFYSTGGQDACTPCPAGSSCPSTSDNYQFVCWAGSYAESGSKECTQCPAGKECPTTTDAPLDCAVGYYSLGSQTACTPCPAGFYCPQNDVEPQICDIGFYSNQSSVVCSECDPGYACPEGSESRVPTDGLCRQGYYCEDGLNEFPCPAGTYGNRTGATSANQGCGTCPQGFYCPEATVGEPGNEYLCPRGHYCSEGTTVATEFPCPGGTYNAELGKVREEDCVDCQGGTYCPSGSASERICPKGKYCPGATAGPVDCPAGTFTEETGTSAETDCKGCPAGYYCPTGTDTPIACLAGTYNARVGQDDIDDCKPCIAGWACTQPALIGPDYPCDPGYYCPEGSDSPNDITHGCPAGTYTNFHNLTTQYQCETCPEQVACLLATGGQQRPPEACAPGHYCPAGTEYPEQFPCPAGSYTNLTNLKEPAECYVCTKGYFCLEGSVEPTAECPTGHYCPPGTRWATEYPCHAGSYSDRTGNVRWEVCTPCPEGYYCPQGSSYPTSCPPGTFRDEQRGAELADCGNCTHGYYCNGTGNGEPAQCTKGYYSDWGAEECSLCQPGFYCNLHDTSMEKMCADLWCPAGMWCKEGRSTAPDLNTDPCPQGHYCLRGDVDAYPRPCPEGTYTDQNGTMQESDCVLCPAGYYCNDTGLTAPAPPDGITGGLCPAGGYCPAGSAVPAPCPVGYYSNSTGSKRPEDCIACDPGYFNGTFVFDTGRQELSQCDECTPGKYCSSVGLQEVSGDCQAGYYCLAGSNTSTPTPESGMGDVCPVGYYCPAGTVGPYEYPCGNGTYNNVTQAMSVDDCLDCPPGEVCEGMALVGPTGLCAAGYYCTRAAYTKYPDALLDAGTGAICPMGHYCPQGSPAPKRCEGGYYTNITGQEECFDCPAGFYCADGETLLQCPRGNYCPQNTGGNEFIPCPRGYYNPDLGLASEDQCLPCAPGKYCTALGASDFQSINASAGPCDAGYYCVLGNNVSNPFPCGKGFYCDFGSFEETPCDSGYYQDEEGQGSCKVCNAGYFCDRADSPVVDYTPYSCIAGYYCPNGTEYDTQYGCLNGTYSTTPNLERADQCDSCPPGKYCQGIGLNAVTVTPVPDDAGVTGAPCTTGHYCPEGTAVPIPCDPGTFMINTHAEECEICPTAHYCVTGLDPERCPPVTPVPDDAGVTGAPCTTGHYCPEGTAVPIPCDPGTFMINTHAEECEICPAAHYCVTGLDPERCPPGYYCPEGTGWVWQSCPPGTFSNNDGLANETECQTCSAGMYCSSPNATAPTAYCDAGYFCAEGSDTPTPEFNFRGTAGICPEGHYCPVGTSTPNKCPRGTFSDITKLTAQAECTDCLYGTYCSDEGLTAPSGDCYAGFYCLRGAMDPNNPTVDSTGGPCPEGHFCPNGTSFPLGCFPGTYNPLEGQAECIRMYWCPENATTYSNTPCPSGHYCPAGTEFATEYPCPAGTYNAVIGKQSLDDCVPCPPGEYCATPGLATSSGSCSPGWYCIRGAWSDMPTDYGYNNMTSSCYCPNNATGGQCDPGEFCPGGSSQPTPCSPGHYCDSAGLASVSGECDMGYYCTLGASVRDPTDGVTGDICTTGHYCPQGTYNPVSCPSGYYTNATGNTAFEDCNLCLPGSYCGDNGLSEPTDLCDAGFYCPGGQNVSRPEDYKCPPGHYCEIGSVQPSPCIPGEYQDEWEQSTCKTCPSGFYCDATLQNDTFCSHGIQNPQPCPTGHYCVYGTEYAVQFPCPNGTFSDRVQLTSVNECTPCSGGYYCGQEGLSAPSGECTAGYYCISGAYMSTPLDGTTGDICPEGAYCPSGSNTSTLCPPGTYNPTLGLTSEDECLGCTPGDYCPEYGMSTTAGNCSAGYFCSGSASTSTPTDGTTGNVCPIGHYCPAGSSQPLPCEPGTYTDTTLNEVCLRCPSGHYCTSGSNPQDCPAGFYCPEVESGQCDAGYYCRSGSDSPMPSLLSLGDANICPPGFYCSLGTAEPEPCPPSTFNNQTGITSEFKCQSCLEGYYCEVPGLEYPSGFCEAGFYCTLGSNSSRPSQTSVNGGPCPAGSYCEIGSSVPTLCVAGTYNPIEEQSVCLDCPAGYYCQEGSITITECPVGHFCPLNTEFDIQYPCNNGTYNNRTRGESVDDCELCTPGTYCPFRGMEEPAGLCAPGWYCSLAAWKDKPTTLGNDSSECHCPAQSTGGMCYAGSFCPAGSSQPIPCTPGYYCLDDKLDAESGLCMAGYYCNGSTIFPDPVNQTTGDMCPMGHYCPEGSSYPEPCEPGTFSDRYANHLHNDCIPCTAGMYCTGWGRDLPNGDCDEGWFCPEGSTAAQPPGNECLAGHACPVGSPDQTPCMSGYYQPLPGQGSCIECSAGMYCDQNEAIEEEQSGIGAPSHGVVTPKDCPAGFNCPNGTLTARQFPCPVSTYSNTTNLESEAECRPCPEGHYCEAENITTPTGICAAGYYCVLYATTPTPEPADATGGPCPQGTFCEAGASWHTPCPKGTFGDRDKLPSEADCTDCYPGMHCMRSGLTEPNGTCLAGYYCRIRAVDPNPVNESYGDICPAGSYCPEGSPEPIDCPAGTYQPDPMKSSPSDCLPCTPGYFCNGTGLSDVSGFCYEGFYCIGSASSPTPRDGVTGDICPPGSYCEEGSPSHTYCSNGTYMNHSMASECYDCPPGSYCVNRDRADPCPPGLFCPAKTGADLELCASGTYNPIFGIYEQDQCLQCDGGYYCQEPGSANVTGLCSAGYYCRYGVNMPEPNGGHTGDGAICPVGHYCPVGSPDPIGCAPGTYNELTGRPVCELCQAGYYCLENATTYLDTICPTGHYCPAGTGYDIEYPCPMGTYNPVAGSDALEDCLECPAGEYCESDGLEFTSGNCSEGWYCTGGSYTSTPLPFSNATDISECTCPLVNYTGGKCWPGTYCPSGSPYPVECDEGMYCLEWGRSQPNGLCDAGYFCDGGEHLPDPTHGLCPAGFYCVQGSHTPTPCPAGTYSDTEGNVEISDCMDCTPGMYCEGNNNTEPTGDCTEGYYCPAGQSTPTPNEFNCTIGHFCPTGSPTPEPCISGQYQDEEGKPTCKACPAGYYCDATEAALIYGVASHGVVIPVDCVAGYYCPESTQGSHQYPCLEGYYSNITQLETHAQCQPCPGGTYCDGQGLTAYADVCDAGFVCVSAANNSRPTDGLTGYECQPGYYCPKGSDQGIKCPVGTFSDEYGLENVTECQACTPGYYCQTEGLTAPTGPCLPGFYCTLGAIDPNPISEVYGDTCPAGRYCPEGTYDPILCPIGTFLHDTGHDELSDCIDCTGGKYCDTQGQTNVTGDCDPGFYCTSRANTSSPLDGVTGDECPAGSYCELGSSAPIPCNDGYYMNHTQASACDICPVHALAAPSGLCLAGYFCNGSSIVRDPEPCSAGYYCPEGTEIEEPCPPGTFSGKEYNVNITDCEECTPGSYCEQYGLAAPSGLCAAGYFCPGGQASIQPVDLACSPGHFCFEGSWNQTGCPSGYYQPHWSRSNCDICPQGFYCKAFGDYEDLGCRNMTLAGNFSGRYRSYRGVAVPIICPEGSYCPEGTTYEREYLCPAGTYSNMTGLYNAGQCTPCTPGMFCQGEGNIEPSGDCTAGYYCTSGAYNSTPTDAVTGNICPAGKYCEIGSITGVGCPMGTYSDQLSLQSAAECSDCTGGYYCGQTGLTKESGLCWAGFYCTLASEEPNPISQVYGDVCWAGYYCPNGTDYPVTCPSGTFLPSAGMDAVDDCLYCTGGYYCESSGQTNVTGLCQAGFYCIIGANTSTPQDGITGNICWEGHYCEEGSAWPSACPNGTFMNHTGASVCDICPAGYFCTQGHAERCPQGDYCPEGTGWDTQMCPVGTYGATTSLIQESDCTDCTGGQQCSIPGSPAPNGPCNAGHYCELGVNTATPTATDGHTGVGGVCPPGTYCPSNTPTPIPCPAGTYTIVEGESSCTPCLAGHYCPGNTSDPTIYPCPVGHYCPIGTEYSIEYPCPEGHTTGLKANKTAPHVCCVHQDSTVREMDLRHLRVIAVLVGSVLVDLGTLDHYL
uniref:Uncharacterized protein LOC100369099 n=1 Tax=Saccoglossus kowalevskii TaxID=10224 RepID=A0ABM0MP26_SACKO|nr:PREDICTED: uncharacterized protein LOC100369099 [Saccoglossus kowalevskii]